MLLDKTKACPTTSSLQIKHVFLSAEVAERVRQIVDAPLFGCGQYDPEESLVFLLFQADNHYLNEHQVFSISNLYIAAKDSHPYVKKISCDRHFFNNYFFP